MSHLMIPLVLATLFKRRRQARVARERAQAMGPLLSRNFGKLTPTPISKNR
jgi:hypothetical protein